MAIKRSNCSTRLFLLCGTILLAPTTMAAEEALSETRQQAFFEMVGEFVEVLSLDVCPPAYMERELINEAIFYRPGSTELYLYGCGIGTLVPTDTRYDVCGEVPVVVLNNPVTSIHVPLHEWEKLGAMEEAERLIALGCVDGAMEASAMSKEPGNEELRDIRQALHQRFGGQQDEENSN